MNVLKLTVRDLPVAVVTMDRPHVANALNTDMAQDIIALFEQPHAHVPGALCLVLTGAGKAFCAGADLKQRLGMSDHDWHDQHRIFERAFRAVRQCPLPVIAAVNGAAMGGGLELALNCDFIYAAGGALFALPEVKRGIIPGGGGTQWLARAVGERTARELILTGRTFTAAEARGMNLVTMLCDADNLLEEAVNTGRQIAANAPLAVAAARRAMRDGAGRPAEDAAAIEIREYDPLVATADRREGIAAFNEKRSPRFSGK